MGYVFFNFFYIYVKLGLIQKQSTTNVVLQNNVEN